MTPVRFKGANIVIAAAQEEYEPLEGFRHGDPEGRLSLCFRLSDAELEEIARSRTLWIQVLTFGGPMQPIGLSTQLPPGVPPQ
jgi:hypothetical protein